jgi:hypothetical protein
MNDRAAGLPVSARRQAYSGPEVASSAKIRGACKGVRAGEKGVLPASSLLLVSEKEGSRILTLEDLLDDRAGVTEDPVQREAISQAETSSEVLADNSQKRQADRKVCEILEEAGIASPGTSQASILRPKEGKTLALSGHLPLQPSSTEQFIYLIQSSLDWVEALGCKMKNDIRVSVTSTRDFAVQCLHFFVFIVLRYLLKVIKSLYIGHLLCLVGLGSTYAAVVAEIEGKVGVASNEFGEPDTEKEGKELGGEASKGQANMGLLPPQRPEDKDKMTVSRSPFRRIFF